MESIRKFRQFIDDTIGELKRTSWPSRPEVYGTTMVVVVAVIIIAAYLWVVDLVLATATQALFNLAA